MMMKWNNIIFFLLLVTIFATSCNRDDEFSESIFVDEKELDPSSPTYNFDLWLIESYLKPYNLDFKYKMEDVGSDMFYNLVPASIEKSKELAQLIKFLWFDVYVEMVDEEFMKQNGPRIIHLIGSPAYSPNSGTMMLGTAEGGIKVTLFNCNNLNYKDKDMMNEFYFKTMHHEFAHILHQKKSYPKEFEQISAGNYSPMGWQFISDNDAAKMGFVSSYSASEAREDFVEIIANYLVKSNADWNRTLNNAGMEGSEIILKKLDMCAAWLSDKWAIDIHVMRNEILNRQNIIDNDFFDKNL
jgi:substrate import-associated zinc metallohydrolase lipoprotein